MAEFDAVDAVDPIVLFETWFELAKASEVNDPNAMSLATATAEGRPSVRMVLMKKVDEKGFTFYTNEQSQKGQELKANPHAALCFHWKSMRRQVRVEGPVEPVSVADSDEYFHSRSRRSQIGAVASQQSRPLASRSELEEKAAGLAVQYPGTIPRPEHWRGFLVIPERIEFWQDGPDRLHDRILFERDGSRWNKMRLYP
ncbi:pyridoxamine 5'-phosphate oxidase [Granulicella aggregans]|uniref:Pyridoxamine 5'-phosphate oxidase n=1 Tax=Granulicella aggregans TaxID=474949 RepID=A0A7W7ZH86_9BACT|nr:pyridoxamine 5'-phosphate oxidase [Granulicella aggregans]MBB5059751.1 pyridoxamine 5'-phosphate oxidase [Granulicella aggregans]